MTKEKLQQEYNLTDDQYYGREKINGHLDLKSLTSIPEGFNPTVVGSLELSNLTSIPEGFNPTVGGNLYLIGLTSIPEGFNPTVGWRLFLPSVKELPEGFNPTVGGEVYYNNNLKAFSPSLGDNYIKRDNKLFKIITQKKNKKFRVINVIQVGTNKGFILVFDHNNNLIKEMPL